MNEIILEQHYKSLLEKVKGQLIRRGYDDSVLKFDKRLDFVYLNQEVKAEDIWFLREQIDEIKKFDSNSSFYYKNKNRFLIDKQLKLSGIKYEWEVVRQGDLIVKRMLEDAESKLKNHFNTCVCNCNYCAANFGICTNDQNQPELCSCNCNYCACNCDYCACNCNYNSGTQYTKDHVLHKLEVLKTAELNNRTGRFIYVFDSIADTVAEKYTILIHEETFTGALDDVQPGIKLGTQVIDSVVYRAVELTNNSTLKDTEGNTILSISWNRVRVRLDVFAGTNLKLLF